MPSRACTLRRSVFRIVSSVSTPRAFLRKPHALLSSSCGTRLLMTRNLCAIARATLRLAHQPEPSYGSLEYCRFTRCIKVGSWKSGNMQLKFSKKSFNNERASSLCGKDTNVRRTKMSPKISGFQCTHLLSSTAAEEIISWKELSPVFSFTHCIPFGEKMENPDDDPGQGQLLFSRCRRKTYQCTLTRRSCLSRGSTSCQIRLRLPLRLCVGQANSPGYEGLLVSQAGGYCDSTQSMPEVDCPG